MFLTGGPHGDFNILAQSRKEFHKASDRKAARAVAHQQGNLGLLHAENFGDLHLGHAAALKDRINLQGELRFEQPLLGIWEAKICKDVSAAVDYAGNALAFLPGFGCHPSSAFLGALARLRPVARSILLIYVYYYIRVRWRCASR